MAGDRGGWEDWTWDETLFAGAAAYYEQGRVPYAQGLAAALIEALQLDGHGRLLDVGCGPGRATLRLAPLFEQVVGLDPDAGMLVEAEQAASRLGITNVRWVCERAEALPAGLGSFRVATFAASFHWMDRPRVAALVRDMLDPAGAVVQIHAPDHGSRDAGDALPHPSPPDQAIDELTRRYLGSDRRAGQGIRNTSPGGEDAVFRAAGFPPARRLRVPDGRVIVRTVDDLVARCFSSSFTAPHLFGDRREAFEADLRRVLDEASPSGLFSVTLPDNFLSIWTRDPEAQTEASLPL